MFHILQNSTILLHWKLVQFIGAVYSAVHWLFTKYKEYSAPWSAAAAAAQLIYFCAMNVCLWPTPLLHKCASQIAHCTIVQSTHMCVTLNCATWNAQCAGGDFVQCVIKNLTVLSQNLDDPYYLCISMCSCRCANVCTCSGSCTMEAVLGKIKSGRGDFPIRCLVFYDPKMLQNRRN